MTHLELHCLLAAELGLKPWPPGSSSNILSPEPRNTDSANRKQNVPI